MKRLALALLVVHSTLLLGAKSTSPAADYPVTIHVVFSRSTGRFNGSYLETVQQLQATIDGQPVELQGVLGGVLTPTDYPARLIPAQNPPRHPNTYDVYERYELLLPDGTVRSYDVIGLGPKAGMDGSARPAASTHP